MRYRLIVGIMAALALSVGIANASNFARLRLTNRYSFPISAEIRDGNATSTGASCETNEFIVQRTFDPGASLVLDCGGRDGYCYRWKRARGTDDFPPNWSGVSCGGHTYLSKTDIKDADF